MALGWCGATWLACEGWRGIGVDGTMGEDSKARQRGRRVSLRCSVGDGRGVRRGWHRIDDTVVATTRTGEMTGVVGSWAGMGEVNHDAGIGWRGDDAMRWELWR